jgi:hypothetical protein
LTELVREEEEYIEEGKRRKAIRGKDIGKFIQS